jgi:hypothetical protein
MAVVLEHVLGDVASDVHDGLIACAALSEVRDERVPMVMPFLRHVNDWSPLHSLLQPSLRFLEESCCVATGLERRSPA